MGGFMHDIKHGQYTLDNRICGASVGLGVAKVKALPQLSTTK
jgi:hypothetical protein